MFDAVIFDMDGLLIDSEPHWQRAQYEVFTALGVRMTPESVRQTVGLRTRDHIEFWYPRHPWIFMSKSGVAERIMRRAVELIRQRAVPLPGAIETVHACAALGVPLAVASSSAQSVLDALLSHLGIADCFEVVQSAEHEPFGKPHPGVYLAVVRRLGVGSGHCLAFEDSVTGVTAAKAAGMTCIDVPARDSLDDPRFRLADEVFPSLTAFDAQLLARIRGHRPTAGDASASILETFCPRGRAARGN